MDKETLKCLLNFYLVFHVKNLLILRVYLENFVDFLLLFDFAENSKKMLAKIPMFECYLDEFQSKGNYYVKNPIHFHSKCNNKHHYVLFCEKHPHGANPIPQMIGKRCTCTTGCSHQICLFCANVRYFIYFRCFKLCVKKIAVSI